jgi:hypothetical protein
LIRFGGHKGDLYRIGSQLAYEGKGLRLILKLLEMYPQLTREAPLSSYTDEAGVGKIIQSRELATWLRKMLKDLREDHPEEYSGHSGRIGGATHLWENGASMEMIMQAGRWKSDAFLKYIRNTVSSAIRVSNMLMK